MHLLISLALIFGFCALLIAGLLRILKDLAERDFHAAPLMADRDPLGLRSRSALRFRSPGRVED